jgi:hypothetical protein
MLALERGHGVVVGLLRGAGGDAEVAGFRVDGVEAAVLARLDPGDVVADRGDLPAAEGLGRDQHGEVGLAAGAGEGGGDVGLLALAVIRRRGSACARPASPGRAPWWRRCAGRSTSCRAGRCRRSRNRRTRSRASRGSARCTWCPCCRASARPAGRASRGWPTLCRQGTNSPSVPSVEHRLAHAGHDAHVGDDIGRVGDLDADVGDGLPSGPMLNGITYIVRPRMQPLEQAGQLFLHLAGSSQLLLGPASSLFCEQMKVRSSTRATSEGSDQAR